MEEMSAILPNSTAERFEARSETGTRRRPRVLQFITSFDVGGTERQCVELLNRIDQERFDVRLAVLNNRGAFLERIVHRFPSPPEFPLTAFYNLNAAKQLMRLRRLLKKERIEILHAHDFYSGILGAAAARLTSTRVIAAQRHIHLSDRYIHEIGQQIAHKLAHKILVNSAAIRDHIVAKSGADPKKIVVVHNGLNVPTNVEELRREQRAFLRSELNLDKDALIIGCAARLQPVKGHNRLIEAAREVIAQQPEIHFALIGDGPLRSKLEAQAEELGIAGQVHFMGERKDSTQLVAGFDLAALASLHEGLPNTVMEAMGVGVPVVATAVPGTTELVKDYETGVLAPPENAAGLAERLLFALSHLEEMKLIGGQGRRYIQNHFSMQQMVNSVENLYYETLTGRSGK
jgi:L-malate glycosyltransferase